MSERLSGAEQAALGGYPILAFEGYEPIIEIGYQSARDAPAAAKAAKQTSAQPARRGRPDVRRESGQYRPCCL